jgi:hypothetical protein
MKYRTFRNLVVVGAGSTLAALVATCSYFGGSSQTAQTRPLAATAPAPVAADTSTRTAVANTQTNYPPARVSTAPGAATQPQSAQRREDQLILNFLNTRAATTDKVKDAFPRESFKVNFYRDEGSSAWTRIKIDYDRDGKDDEKWDLQDGQPNKRRIATRDDEQYDREYRWRNAQWVEKK